MNELSSDGEGIGCCCDFFTGAFNEGSGKNVIGVVVIGGRGGLFKIFEESCVVGVVSVSSLESETGELVSEITKFCEIGCD